MRKIKFLLVTMFAALFFTACGNKYSVENLKKNDKLLKETAVKCKEKNDEKICKNVDKAQSELAQENWKKVKPEIKAKFDKFTKDIMAGNYATVINEIPEKYLKYVAEKNSTSVEELKKMMTEILKIVQTELKIENVVYDVDAAKIGRTSAGRNYAIISSVTTVVVDNQKVDRKQDSLVFEDENKWYIMNLDENTLKYAKKVYPDFEEIKVK